MLGCYIPKSTHACSPVPGGSAEQQRQRVSSIKPLATRAEPCSACAVIMSMWKMAMYLAAHVWHTSPVMNHGCPTFSRCMGHAAAWSGLASALSQPLTHCSSSVASVFLYKTIYMAPLPWRHADRAMPARPRAEGCLRAIGCTTSRQRGPEIFACACPSPASAPAVPPPTMPCMRREPTKFAQGTGAMHGRLARHAFSPPNKAHHVSMPTLLPKKNQAGGKPGP